MNILGLSAFYHDSAAVLIRNGKVVCAIEEERFTRIKHDNSFPLSAAQWCLRQARTPISEIDCVAYYEKPLLKFERTLDMFIQTWPKSFLPFIHSMPELLGDKLNVEGVIRKKLGYKGKIAYVPHHLSHASAAYYSSPFQSSAVLTVDGVGEYQTTALWKASKGKIELLKEIHFPHSLGLFYSTCAAYLGFKVNEDEYKLMGLAAYGKPLFITKLRKVVQVSDDGGFALDMNYFSFRESDRMWTKQFEALCGPARKTGEKINQRHADFARSVQVFTEELYLRILNHLYAITGEKNVCISGGVALNALANGLIHLRTPFTASHVFGPAGDSGAALGAALYINRSMQTNPYRPNPIPVLTYGSSYTDTGIEKELKKHKDLLYAKMGKKELIESAASSIRDGKIIGWFQGQCELGPRALGNRSILCRPSPRNMKAWVNVIKIREQFRPFAGSVLQSRVHELFQVPMKKYASPFMNYCFTVLKEKRPQLAAIVHADHTCRIQTVSPVNGKYFDLITRFYQLSGIPCVLNTSFNLKGEPIVESPGQAIADFMKTKMDELYIGSFRVTKK